MGKSLMEDLVIEKLSTVYDPEVPVNIWELGLVYNIEFPKQNEVIVTMTLTAPGCPIADQIVQEVHDVVLTIDGIDEATGKPDFRTDVDSGKNERNGPVGIGF